MSESEAAAGRSFRDRLYAAWQRLRGGTLSPGRAAASIFVGLLVGCSPFYGVHAPIVLAICIPLRLDAAIAYVAAHVSNPITGPALFLLEFELGSLLLDGAFTHVSVEAAKKLGFLMVGGHLFAGFLVVGPLCATLGGGITWVLTARVRALREPERARARKKTRARYRPLARPVRWYVRIKLVMDPALDAIASLPGSLGRVVDAGSGVGHVGIGLLDQGRATSLHGVDVDPERVRAANAAAHSDATFETAELRTFAFPECDTVLFTDTLHYLTESEQKDVLARAAHALGPGGRIVVREVEQSRKPRSRLTESIERRAARRRGQSRTLTFRSSHDLLGVLESLGLRARVVSGVEWSLLEHVLIVGEKPTDAVGAPDPTSQTSA